MENFLEIYKQHLTIETGKLLEISEKLIPLQKEKERTEKNIQALKQLIGSDEETKKETKKEISKGPMNDKTPIEAYEILARDHFQGKSFKEPQISKFATEQGLEVNGKPISGSYSRGIISRMLERGILEKIKKGVYCYKEKGSDSHMDESEPLLKFGDVDERLKSADL